MTNCSKLVWQLPKNYINTVLQNGEIKTKYSKFISTLQN